MKISHFIVIVCLVLSASVMTTNSHGGTVSPPTEVNDLPCKVEFESQACSYSQAVECYIAHIDINGMKYTYEVKVLIIEFTYETRYWLTYKKFRSGETATQLTKYFETTKQALSNWVNKFVGDGCTYSFR